MDNKTTEKSSKTMPCFDCDTGQMERIVRDYWIQGTEKGNLKVSDVPMFICESCGSTAIGDEGNRVIEAYLDRVLNAITPEEVQAFLAKYHLTQKEASRITGLGEKNISRWASGKLRASESVSNLLRLLLADEAAFERLRVKNFVGTTTTKQFPTEERQPSPEETEVLAQIDYPAFVHAGIFGETRSPKERRSQICRWGQSEDLMAFAKQMRSKAKALAAFKDTRQKSNFVSAGMWVKLGEDAGRKIETQPFTKRKLRQAAKELRNLTSKDLAKTAPEVRTILAQVGVALVLVPRLKESSMRGCTMLMNHNKALIIHALKYRSLSQFWLILFHEIAHLLLHIDAPGHVISEYQDQKQDKREEEADQWAYDFLSPADKELEFRSRYRKPSPNDIRHYAEHISIHPAIAAEIFNRRSGREVISYSMLKKFGLFPQLNEKEFQVLTKMI